MENNIAIENVLKQAFTQTRQEALQEALELFIRYTREYDITQMTEVELREALQAKIESVWQHQRKRRLELLNY